MYTAAAALSTSLIFTMQWTWNRAQYCYANDLYPLLLLARYVPNVAKEEL